MKERLSKDSYQTPPAVFAYMNAEFDFKSDVCASKENSLCHYYITEELDCLKQSWFTMCIDVGDYVWANVPYSNVMPFVKRFAEISAKGIGTVMLVMMDQSVGWYKEAIKTCQEVRLVIGGRLSFIDPATGKPAAGNNKGSMFLIWHPFGRTPVVYSHIDRDEMLDMQNQLIEEQNRVVELAAQVELLKKAGNLLCINLSYSTDIYAGDYKDYWKRTISLTPAQCHDEVRAQTARDAFLHGCEFCESHDWYTTLDGEQAADEYANKIRHQAEAGN